MRRWQGSAGLAGVVWAIAIAVALPSPVIAAEPPAPPPSKTERPGERLAKPAPPKPTATEPAPERPCGKADFEAVVEEAATALRDLNITNKPAFQDKLRALKDKRGWAHDVFLKEAAPFVRDDKTAEFDHTTDELLNAIASMGQAGASAKSPDCALLLELRARMTLLVSTQTAKWGYMFDKIELELRK